MECSERETLKEIASSLSDTSIELYRQKEEMRSISERVNNTEKLIDAVHSLSTNVALLSDNVTTMKESMTNMEADIKDIQQAPAIEYKKLRRDVLMVVIGATLMYLLDLILP